MKRKLNYKKILIAVGVLTVTVAVSATVTVGILKATQPKPKKDLNLIINKKEVNGNQFNTEQTVLDEIIRLNNSVSTNDVEIKNFQAATELKAGTAELHAKANSKYTGKVNITITELDDIFAPALVEHINSKGYNITLKDNNPLVSGVKLTLIAEIKNNVDDKFKPFFKEEKLTINKITKIDSQGGPNCNQFNDRDFAHDPNDHNSDPKLFLVTYIHYDYGTIKNQITKSGKIAIYPKY